jgi:hypothetical protein
MVDNYNRCVPAYYKGFQEFADVAHIKDHCARELMLIAFGYRLVEWIIDAGSPEEKEAHIKTLQKIYEMENFIKV